MYLILAALLGVFTGWGLWRLLGRTALKKPVRLLLAVPAGGLAAFVLYWLLLRLSIVLYQASGPITW